MHFGWKNDALSVVVKQPQFPVVYDRHFHYKLKITQPLFVFYYEKRNFEMRLRDSLNKNAFRSRSLTKFSCDDLLLSFPFLSGNQSHFPKKNERRSSPVFWDGCSTQNRKRNTLGPSFDRLIRNLSRLKAFRVQKKQWMKAPKKSLDHKLAIWVEIQDLIDKTRPQIT